MDLVADPGLERRLVVLERAVAALLEAGAAPVDGRDAYVVVRRLEQASRQLRAVQLDAWNDIDRRGLHLEDGHRSAKALVRFAADLSPAEAGRRDGAAKVLEAMPEVAARFRAGRIGLCHLAKLAAVHANPRVRERLEAVDAEVAVVAEHLRYDRFSTYLANWERIADEDGAARRAERAHENRCFRGRRNLDATVAFDGGCGSLQGTSVLEVLAAFERAELEADWAEARSRLGDAASVSDLVRTEAQRSMDALEAMTARAAQAFEAATGHLITTNLVVDQVTFERNLARIGGVDPGPDPRLEGWWRDLAVGLDDLGEAGEGPEPGAERALVGYRCSTLDGQPIDPTEASFAALLGHVRRVVTCGDGVVLDMGRRRRLFTGSRHLAVMLSATHCPWPGCTVPNAWAQADHLEEWRHGGRTCPSNGAPGCGKHNRHRNHGFEVARDSRTGELYVTRPDGTRIE